MSVPGTGYTPITGSNNWGAPDNEYLKLIALAQASSRDFADIQNQLNSAVLGSSNATIGAYPIVASGTNTYTGTFTDLTYFTGLFINLLSITDNTGASTFNLNGLGAKSIKVRLTDGTLRDVQSGEMHDEVSLIYDGTQFIVIQSDAKELWRYVDNIGGKNLLINGNFDIWQRGDSITTGGGYTADRWYMFGASTPVSKILNDDDSIPSKNVCEVAMIGVSPVFYQKIENKNNVIKNKKVTLSFMVKSTVSQSISAQLAKDNYSTVVQAISYPVTTDWQKIELTFDAGANWTYDDIIVLTLLRAPTNNTVPVYFANVKLEIGDVATDFIPRTYSEELRDCQRYYRVIGGLITDHPLFSGLCTVNNQIQTSAVFENQMRIAPTITTSGTFVVRYSGGTVNLSTLTFSGITTNGFIGIGTTASAPFTVGQASILRSTGIDNGVIKLDAEL